ncbi:MAG: hypothetical protein A2X97_04565 [Bdellovibrionales bacterium GWA1_52_35]|nr:MAG: hypothetical protein A2X97_04565 [Bdellovibrionales bacterium GWA1_52_35]HCM38432.1 hypothetical protein [Bdellovibrionales bacterium]
MGLFCVSQVLPGSSLGAEQIDPLLKKALSILNSTSGGKLLLEKAVILWEAKTLDELSHHLRWSSTSRTDAVLTRQFDPMTGQETRSREVTIYLKRTTSMPDLVLDIAHEMVHATSRPAWDPYDPALTAGKYIWTTLEGEGGEVEAVIAECRISSEVPSFQEIYKKRCSTYLDSSKALVDRTKVRQDFYRVGRWNKELLRELGHEVVTLPLLTADEPRLISSTGSTPYPVALLREYRELTQVACENSKKRIEVAAHQTVGRSLASETTTPERENKDFLQRRCKSRTF